MHPIRFGAHLGLQDTTAPDVVALAVHAEQLGFDWVSVWDHFLSSSPADAGSLEAVSMQAAIAMATTRVECGVLVYSVTYRWPAVIAKAIATIDQLSGGRAHVGIGAGWSQREHDAFGIPFPPLGRRMDMLDEAATCLRRLLHETGPVTFQGRHFQLAEARLEPRPVQTAVPVWIGGAGARRTLPAAARSADGWNAPFLSPELFAEKRAVLLEQCELIGRDPADIRCAANIGVALDDAALEQHFATMSDTTRSSAGGVVHGRGQQLLDGIARYVEAGADQINIALRAPFDRAALEAVAEVFAAFARPAPVGGTPTDGPSVEPLADPS